MFLEGISCVRWSPSGDMLASTSEDRTIALLDFKTGKRLYTGETLDEGKFSLFNKKKDTHLIIRIRYVCVLHLSKNQIR